MSDTTPVPKPPNADRKFAKWWLLFVVLLLVVAVVVVVLVIAAPDNRSADFRAFEVPSSSMEPTILRGDHILADMNYYRSNEPKDRDIVLFKRWDVISIKRIVASAGEKIRGSGGAVYVNEELLRERYVKHTGGAPESLNEFGPVVVPPYSYFVMGDNRDVSLDSRSADIGFVSADSIVGRPVRVMFNWRSGRVGKSIQ